MTRINKTAAVLLTGLFLLVAGTGFSQVKKKGMGMRENAPGMNQKCQMMIPDLTEEQEGKIEELRLSQMKEMMAAHNKINEKKARLKTLQTQDNADMDAIYNVIDEIGEIKTEMHKKKAKHHQEVRSLLNEEQKVYFDKHMMMKKSGMHHKGTPMKGGQGHGKGCGKK